MNLQQKQNMHPPNILNLCRLLILSLTFFSCSGENDPASEIVSTPGMMNEKVTELVNYFIQSAIQNNFLLDDTIQLSKPGTVEFVYKERKNRPVWSSQQNWLPAGDSLLNFIRDAKYWGLFPENYHFTLLDSIRRIFIADSLNNTKKREASLWAGADLLMTDALVQIFYDVKLGRLQNDSVMKRTDSLLSNEFVIEKLNGILESKSLTSVLSAFEPAHMGYHELKKGVRKFLDSADFRSFTQLPFPYSDTLYFRQLLRQRLAEGGYFTSDTLSADTTSISAAIKRFQISKKITVDGKAGAETVAKLNSTDFEKFYRIAITLDRYKMLPVIMPEKYIWVNLPSFQLRIIEKDTIKLVSKIVVGKPHTRTPVLTSTVYEMITYPKWTIPNSIIVKEILPALKRNTKYLSKKGYSLFDRNGEEVNPDSITWSKYSKGIPFNVVQGSGDANALGVMKFNFSNKYQVYMHDTNERYLFSRETRSLSHGCVRVQEWSKMANYLIAIDSLKYKNRDSLTAIRDSVKFWLSKKEKHAISLKNRLPVFFRYFTCEGRNGTLIFYDDIYGEDALLKRKYYTQRL